MNRRDRRAAGKHAGSAGPGSPAAAAEIAALLARAVRHHQAGELRDAERIYRDILARDPNHIKALNFLGLAVHQLGRNDAALQLIEKAITLDEQVPESHYNVALVLQALGRTAEGAAHYERAVALKPDFAAAHMNLGNVRKEQGRPDEAIACYRRVLALSPRAAPAHYNIANVLAQRGDLEEAVAHYRQALALEPGFSEAHNNLGNACKELGRAQEAEAHYRRALALKPDYVEAHDNMARMLLSAGDIGGAFDHLRRALAIGPTHSTKILIVRCLQNLKPDGDDPQLRTLIMRALSEGWVGANELAVVAGLFVQEAPALREGVERANRAWPDRLPLDRLLGPGGLAALAGDRLLQVLLQSAPVCDIALERFLTALRCALLEAESDAADVVGSDVALNVCCALARQCFINEFVFDVTDKEAALVERLRQTVTAALQSGAAVPPLRLAVLASFLPLHEQPGVEALLGAAWPPPVTELLVQQVREPRTELELRASIPALTAIEDDVSIAVREQYEENPYPRWAVAPAPGVPVSIEDDLRNKLPQAKLRSLDKGRQIEILIAGCGTGRHTVETVQRFAGARVLSIDLSLTSLAYAVRKTRELGLSQIEYAQADILGLGSIGRTFDVIESNGVLHHLRDPFAGWRVLVSLLRPGGLMNIGLYSKLARRDVTAVRDFIAVKGYGRGARDIRRCRQDLIAAPEGTALRAVTGSRDFFTTSACRDLLFHVQEHQLTIPDIAGFLAANDLAFLGFEVDVAILHRFGRQFPDPKAVISLDNWHAFEEANPGAFVGMYQFWAQKMG
jgi:tetratricopeptide (TPR) repeat protein/SAM-dependent methyltransferase